MSGLINGLTSAAIFASKLFFTFKNSKITTELFCRLLENKTGFANSILYKSSPPAGSKLYNKNSQTFDGKITRIKN